MDYRINEKNGDKLSALSFGCMRFPKDEGLAEKLVLAAVDMGVNYFDTAYIYAGNEAVLGGIVARNGLRDKIKIATKIPQYLVGKTEDFEKFFRRQLGRLQTDYVDYYLMHMLSDTSQWQHLTALGSCEWIEAKKVAGQIRNIGFSYHGGQADFKEIIDAYPWDFCMIQYNYMDEHNQAGRSGLEYAASKGIPVMIMEPLQGGRLTNNLPPEIKTLWQDAPGNRTPAEWALRWVWNHPEVTTVLSGMNTMEMLKENVRIASDSPPGNLTAGDLELYKNARQVMLDKTLVPCTGCAYCMPCPAGVDIPLCFSCYNATATTSRMTAKLRYITYLWRHNAGNCKKCGQCEKHCPQSIPIMDKLSETAKTMEGFPYKPIRFLAGKVMRRK